MANDTKQPDRDDLPEKVSKRIDSLVKMNPAQMNSAQKRFIKARSVYLTKAEKHDMKAILDADAEDLTPKKAPEAPEQEAETDEKEQTEEDDKNEEEDVEEDDYFNMGRKQLFKTVDERNEGRDEEDQISKGGSNEDIAARLEADDEA